jgi:hypothetical protein
MGSLHYLIIGDDHQSIAAHKKRQSCANLRTILPRLFQVTMPPWECKNATRRFTLDNFLSRICTRCFFHFLKLKTIIRMKRITKFLLFLALTVFLGCEKTEQATNNLPEPLPTETEHGLGAIMHLRAVYNRFERIDVSKLKASRGRVTAELPASYAIAGSAPGHQGSEGSCVGWATAYAASAALEHNFKGLAFPAARRSPEYVYNQIKLSGDCGSGSYISQGLDLIKNQGVCSWDEMPYTDVSCDTQPSASQILAAGTHKFTSWKTVDNTNLADVKTLISHEYSRNSWNFSRRSF